MNREGELVRIDDTSLFVVERGSGYPVIVLRPFRLQQLHRSFIQPA